MSDITYFFVTWLPEYLTQKYGLHLGTVGALTALPWGLTAVMLWIAGLLSDHLFRKTGRCRYSRSYPIWISPVIAALCIIPVIFSKNLYVALLFISLAIGLNACTNSMLVAANIDIIPHRAGTAFGIMDSISSTAFFFASAFTGWIVATTGHFTLAFLLLDLLALSSVIVVFFFHHSVESHHKKTIDHPPPT